MIKTLIVSSLFITPAFVQVSTDAQGHTHFTRHKVEIEKKVKDLTFAGLIWNPLNKINLEKETFIKLVNFLEQIEDDDDVQNVFTNFEVDEKLLEGVN